MKNIINKVLGVFVVMLVSTGMITVSNPEVYENPIVLLYRYEPLMFWREASST